MKRKLFKSLYAVLILISLLLLLPASGLTSPSTALWTWGSNGSGQLGDGTQNERHWPVEILGHSGITAVSGGYWHSLAIKVDGSVWGWGFNGGGELGEGTGKTNSITPVQIMGSGSQVIAVSAGGAHNLALKSDGSVWAWGSNWYGQLGDGTTMISRVPVQIMGPGSQVIAISAGWYHSMALKSDGSLWAWGANWYGQLGDNTLIERHSPVQVMWPGSGVTAISAGRFHHSVALKADGSVWTWGMNDHGQLGDGTTITHSTPVQIIGAGSGVIAIDAGHSHNLALKADGSLWGWGWNVYGQLGDGSNVEQWKYPVMIMGPGSQFIAVSAGGSHSLALKSDGSVWAWGFNWYGQIGDRTWDRQRNYPVQVMLPGSGITTIAAGSNHSMAIESKEPENQPPVITSASTSASALWPPNGKPVDVVISVIVTDPDGAGDIIKTTYSVIDEYGKYDVPETILPSSGVIPLIAERDGQDADGRTYTINVKVYDIGGQSATATVIVTVPHNQS